MKKRLVLFLVSMMALTACSKKEEATDAKADAVAEAKADNAPAAENDPFEGLERTTKAFYAFLKDKSQDEQEALRLQTAKHSRK